MRDRPRCAVWTGAFRGNVKRVVKSFRVCAVCADTGAILDCMGWTCTATAAPKDSGTVAIPDQTSIPPQEAFDAALREFMKTHVRTEGGKKYWWCPESSQKRGEIPDGFGRQWAPATETGFHWLELDDQQVGGAQLAASATPVLTAGLEDAGHAAVKFTWSGDQDKTTMSLVVSPLRDFTAADIAPFVRRGDARLANDLVALAHQYVSPDFCHNLLSRLSAVPGGLAGAPADVTITIVANLRSDRATAAVGSLDPRTLAGILNELRGFESTEGVRDALQYLSLNLALRTEWRAAAPPRGCLHPASIAAMARSILRS